MKKIFYSLTTLMVAIFFSGCVPPAGGDKTKGGSSGMGGTVQLLFLGGMVVVFWLFFIRPQAKRAKNQKKFIEDLGKGSKVVTIAGIHGIISKVNEDGTLNIEVSPGSYLKIEKSAISMDWTAALNKVGAAGDKK
jgi:preprotein translocase subunit YajC